MACLDIGTGDIQYAPRCDFVSAQIGSGDQIPRWQPGIELTYVVCDETFPTLEDAAFTSRQLTTAMGMWNNAGVTFRLVERNSLANFRVVYRNSPLDGRMETLASSFLPNNSAADKRTLYVYALAFTNAHLNNQAYFLAHEVGHILGLRHEFSMEREQCLWSTTFGSRNSSGIMAYYADSSHWRVTPQDLKEMEAFYNPSFTGQDGRKVMNYTPERVIY
ncbi:matrix metalloproteinase-11 [Purpureocillium lavendulum]|uniref:Matrix metalloproteinase-11 n=1 Tax=Purpureocillium lavendulum TaxID=1247861 RepID=A0AB34FJQ0_9HYPO|nr:matrix metalloproteinase-11 [Purpureocillium lavendulum]